MTDVGLQPFNGITILKTLIRYNTKVGDAGLESVRDCANLTRLQLRKSRVSTGMYDGLPVRHPNAVILLDNLQITPGKK